MLVSHIAGQRDRERAAPAAVRNRNLLLSHGMRELRQIALDIVDAGLAAIDPYLAVQRTLSLDGSRLRVADRTYDLDAVRSIYLLGAGKATLRIAEAVVELLGDRLRGGMVIIPRFQRSGRGSGAAIGPIDVWEADHPLPSAASMEGARRLLARAGEAGAGDLVIAAVTGGSSALACLPPASVSLEEKRELHRLLLSSGATIAEVNIVRKHVSDIKGGRLALRARPAAIVNLTVSDVAGDPEEYITDLTVQNTSSVDDALEVLRRYRLWDRIAPSIRNHLAHSERAQLPDLDGMEIQTVMMVTGETACRAMASRARELAIESKVASTTFEGESQVVGKALAQLGIESGGKNHSMRPYVLLGCGGETTVSLADDPDVFGLGGPNQETALAAGLALQAGDQVVITCLDTDGSDGGGEYAGGIVDGLTVTRALAAGVDLELAMAAHHSSAALGALGDLVVTGATMTNVNDMFVIAVAAPG
jgi:glycerate 2-kinase